ncbi:hypothetical protein [Butyrivibrio hungatei]|uniref:hypothetical protein n=1 Tax=Butyrivibrio hungatei TaxID=185008 RepID=UPI000401F56B|nr:hypothetical protein [Butyrivibrio hungatei]
MSNKEKEIFLNGIDNLKAIGFEKQLSFMTSMKMFLFYICLCVVSKKQSVNSEVFFINGYFEAKKNNPATENFQRIHVRKFTDSIKDLREKVSIVSTIPVGKRFWIILSSVMSTPRGGHNLGRWLEYRLLREAFGGNRFNAVCSFGHYDEFTYWLTELCAEHKASYSMYQHGVVTEKIIIPNKIYCDEVHLYNKFSETVFRDVIVKNDSCRYYIDGFKTNIEFKHMEKQEGKKYVGIVDQTFPDWLTDITECILGLEGYVAVVMLHPLSAGNMFEGKESIIETRDKYDNLDCIIVDFSTLVLDYISIGYDGPIICTSREACEGLFGEYGLKYVDKEKLQKFLPNVIKER